MKTLAVIALALLCTCAPSQNSARYGRVTVAISTDWREPQRSWIRDELVSLNALGPSFSEASEGSADVVVREFDSGAGCVMGAGMVIAGTHTAYVDPACAQGEMAFRLVVGHEVSHTLGLGHVCRHDGDVNCHGVGIAMMNPLFDIDGYGPNFDEAYTGSIVPFEPTILDLDEFNRTREGARP